MTDTTTTTDRQEQIDAYEADANIAYEDITEACNSALAELQDLRDTLAGTGEPQVAPTHWHVQRTLRSLADVAEGAAATLEQYEALAEIIDAEAMAEFDAECAATR